jgi:hypothetical protein
MHRKPRGHSNAYVDETARWPGNGDGDSTAACIPMIGGGRVDSCKPLPPLALSEDDWRTIGSRMGWVMPRQGND